MKNKWKVVILLGIAQFVMVLDGTVMNVSISTVVKDLNTTVAGLQAAITFFTLTMAAFMLTGGKLGDKFGRLRALKIGSIIYGIGSLITAISPSLGVLMFGWSLVEGLGAVLVIPAIAALIAINYKGKDRVVGYAIIGGVAGAAAAAGPLIGGFVTTYLSWRYVFATETAIMVVLLFFMRSIKDEKQTKKTTIDVPSIVLSTLGMGVLVFGILQSKVWGWAHPINTPQINGHNIAPFGISIVAYLILAGIMTLWMFYNRQVKLKAAKKEPLLDVSMLKIIPMRAGLMVLLSQYFIIAATFFVVPIYLQMVLGLDALQTGIKILPMSIALIVFSVLGSRLISKYTPKRIVRIGQILLILGALTMLSSIDPEIKSRLFATGMFLLGAGLGLLASQLGNVIMSSIDESKSSEAGGLQGTFQNLGSSLGTAIVGSVMITALSAGFVANVNQNNQIPQNVQSYIQTNSKAGIQVVSAQQVEDYALNQGLTANEATAVADSYKSAQIESLRESVFFIASLATLSILLSRNIQNTKVS